MRHLTALYNNMDASYIVFFSNVIGTEQVDTIWSHDFLVILYLVSFVSLWEKRF